MKVDEKKVTISAKEYRKLRYAAAELMLLESGGVDNWDWYSESLYSEGGESLDDLKEQIDQEIEKM